MSEEEAEARAKLGLPPPDPTPEEKYEKRKQELEAFVAEHPGAAWARNELKYMTVDDFSDDRRPIVPNLGGRGVCDAAVHCERVYHGGYID
jgi:hypothetical protein